MISNEVIEATLKSYAQYRRDLDKTFSSRWTSWVERRTRLPNPSPTGDALSTWLDAAAVEACANVPVEVLVADGLGADFFSAGLFRLQEVWPVAWEIYFWPKRAFCRYEGRGRVVISLDRQGFYGYFQPVVGGETIRVPESMSFDAVVSALKVEVEGRDKR